MDDVILISGQNDEALILGSYDSDLTSLNGDVVSHIIDVDSSDSLGTLNSKRKDVYDSSNFDYEKRLRSCINDTDIISGELSLTCSSNQCHNTDNISNKDLAQKSVSADEECDFEPVIPGSSLQYQNSIKPDTRSFTSASDSVLMHDKSLHSSETLTLCENKPTMIPMSELSSNPCITLQIVQNNEILQKQKTDPVRTQWVTTKENKYKLKKNGHTWKKGMWRADEIKKLKENIDKYCYDRGITDPRDIIFKMGKEERKNFYPTISAGLNRPLFAVYRRVKRMYDQRNHLGKYSDEEIKQLKKLVEKYGKNWTEIGKKMGRSSDSVKDRCRLFDRENINQLGKWSIEEENCLARAVSTVTGKELGTDITDGITWSAVAKLVHGRTEKQCRAKWLNYLNWKLNKGEEWTKSDDQLLIERIKNLNISSEDEIDWHVLSRDWKSVRSPQWLRCKWWALKKVFHETQPNKTSVNLNDLLLHLQKIVSSQIIKSWSRNYLDKKVVNPKEKDANNILSELSKTGQVEDQSQNDKEKWLNDYYLTSTRITSNENYLSPRRETENEEESVKISDQMIDVTTSDPMLVVQELEDRGGQDEQITENGTNENAGVMVQFASSPSQGIYLIQNSENKNNECHLMMYEDNNNFNIHLTQEVLTYLNNSAKAVSAQDGDASVPPQLRIVPISALAEMGLQSQDSTLMQTSDMLDFPVTKGNTSPVLSSAMNDVVVNSPGDEESILTSSQSHLQGEELLDDSELTACDDTQ